MKQSHIIIIGVVVAFIFFVILHGSISIVYSKSYTRGYDFYGNIVIIRPSDSKNYHKLSFSGRQYLSPGSKITIGNSILTDRQVANSYWDYGSFYADGVLQFSWCQNFPFC